MLLACAHVGSKTTEVLDMLHWSLIDKEYAEGAGNTVGTTNDERAGAAGLRDNLPGVEPPTGRAQEPMRQK